MGNPHDNLIRFIGAGQTKDLLGEVKGSESAVAVVHGERSGAQHRTSGQHYHLLVSVSWQETSRRRSLPSPSHCFAAADSH